MMIPVLASFLLAAIITSRWASEWLQFANVRGGARTPRTTRSGAPRPCSRTPGRQV